MILVDGLMKTRWCERVNKRVDERRVKLLKPTVILITPKRKRDIQRTVFLEHALEFFHCEDKLTRVASLRDLEIFRVHRVVHADVFDSRNASDRVEALVSKVEVA